MDKPTSERAKNIVRAILADLTDRRGLRHEWERIDDDIQGEIVAEWERLTDEILEK